MHGIIDIGGGLRGIFGAGVLDRLNELDIVFPYTTGVSAGAANLISYISGQKGRNVPFYTEYSRRSEYMSLSNFRKNGSYIDLSYVYGTLSNDGGENPLDYDSFDKYNGTFITVATDALTGNAVYFGKNAYSRNNFRTLMASSCLPAVCKPVFIDDIPYYDGGVSDPIPVMKAMEDGCEKVVLILTRPKDEFHNPFFDRKAALLIKGKYPEAAKRLYDRHNIYNESLKKALELEKEGKVLIIAPDSIKGMGTLTKDKEKLKALYLSGKSKADAITDFL